MKGCISHTQALHKLIPMANKKKVKTICWTFMTDEIMTVSNQSQITSEMKFCKDRPIYANILSNNPIWIGIACWWIWLLCGMKHELSFAIIEWICWIFINSGDRFLWYCAIEQCLSFVTQKNFRTHEVEFHLNEARNILLPSDKCIPMEDLQIGL